MSMDLAIWPGFRSLVVCAPVQSGRRTGKLSFAERLAKPGMMAVEMAYCPRLRASHTGGGGAGGGGGGAGGAGAAGGGAGGGD